MSDTRFLQIHTLHGYSAALLNRDDAGHAKRMNYGDVIRTRISSQCLKRHWRVANSSDALDRIDGAVAAIRSRETVTRRVIQPLRDHHDGSVVDAIEGEFQRAVYGEKGDRRSNRQPLLLGDPEIDYLAREAQRLAEEHASDSAAAGKAAKAWVKDSRANLKALRESTTLPGGLVSALFGRMVTSDPEANIDAAVHVAHAFTVHAEESDSDYFTVVDDLARIENDPGADHIGETELTSGIFYGYVVVDRAMLVANLGGDEAMAGTVTERLVHLIATVSPGAKLGSTAPYGYASWILIEAGERQPRSLAEAFRRPSRPTMKHAEKAARDHLASVDAAFGADERRRWMSVSGHADVPKGERLSLPDLAAWAGGQIADATRDSR